MRAEPRYRQAAANAYRFIRTQLMGSSGLYKAMAKERKLPGAELEDYAFVVLGLLDYAEAAGDRQARQDAVALAKTAWQEFSGEQGWRRERQALLATVRSEPVLADGPVPSPSAVLITATLRLGDAALLARAREALEWHSAAMARDPFSYPTQIAAYRQFLN
jgi:uncharacterized protein YyaL (SSP411 family)